MKKLFFLLVPLLMLSGCENEDLFDAREHVFFLNGITLSKVEIPDMITGETIKLHASFTPAEATDKEVIWESSDPDVAQVSSEGVVTAVSLGSATITVTSVERRDVAASCQVTVSRESGISVTDVLLESLVDAPLVFIRGDAARDYTYFIQIFNSLDKRVHIYSTNPDALDVTLKTIDGKPGFSLSTGTALGEGEIVIASTSTPDVELRLPFSLVTVNVAGITLSLNADGSDDGDAIAGSVTIGKSTKLRVVFATDVENVPFPENKLVTCVSSDPSVATVVAQGQVDPATNHVFIPVTLVDDPTNVTSGPKSAVITVTSDQGSYVASFTVTAQMPTVQGIVLNQNLSDPIHAGGTLQLTVTTIPADAYIQTVAWGSENEDVATVDANGLVTIKPDFVFDPDNCTATEIAITATSDDPSNGPITASCKLRPYQYVPATGVMVTDQWGNRIPGHQGADNVTNTPAEVSVQYCAGTGTNKNTYFNVISSWGKSVPADEFAPDLGSIPIYFTATPVPFTYPTITDPNQEFWWTASGNSRFAFATITSEDLYDGGQHTGGGTYNRNDGKTTNVIKAKTIKGWTGHTATGDSNYNNIRVFLFDAEKTLGSSSLTMLFRFSIHTNVGKDSGSSNPSLAVTGGGKVYNIMRPATPYLDDPAPWPWTGPDPVVGALPFGTAPAYTPATITKIRAQAYPAQ